MTGLRAYLIAMACAALVAVLIWGVTHGEGDWGGIPVWEQNP